MAMNHAVTALASLGLLSVLTVGVGARSDSGQQVVAPQKSAALVPTHAIRGVVKSFSTSSVVIVTGSGKKTRELTFLLTPSTHRDGEPTVGGTVSIRYRLEGNTLMATALSAHSEKQHAERSADSGR